MTIVCGLWWGLHHEDAARFAFLLATPADPGRGRPQAPLPRRQRRRALHGEVVLGVVVAAITAYLSVRFLVRYFETRTLTPVANYCPVFRAASILRLAF